MTTIFANLGGLIGRGIANGEPMAFGLVAFVVVAFYLGFKCRAYWRNW